MNDDALYIQRAYGSCTAAVCNCRAMLKDIDPLCGFWRPAEVQDFYELGKWMQNTFKRSE